MKLISTLLAQIARVTKALEAEDADGIQVAAIKAAGLLEVLYSTEQPEEISLLMDQTAAGLCLACMQPKNGQTLVAALRVLLGTHIAVEEGKCCGAAHSCSDIMPVEDNSDCGVGGC